MRRRSLLLASGLLVMGALVTGARADDGDAVPEAQDGDRRPPTSKIDAAVERGIAWLRKEQKRDGSFGQGPGETALVLLTMRHSAVPPTDRANTRAARYLERDLPDGTVYGAALGALSLLAQDPVLHRAKVEELVEDLVAAQCENGQWTYAYRATSQKPSGDNSNTQFAILALGAARVAGIPVPDEPFARSRAFLTSTQNADGGFGYSDKERSRSYASMTAGSAMCLAFSVAVTRGVPLGSPSVADDPTLEKALDWLRTHFDAAANTGAALAFGSKKKKRSDAFWRHYWLWSVERVAAAAGQERLGRHDWYGAGSRVLLARQQDDGQWRDPERELLATCFALLFFRRSTQITITPRDRVTPTVTPSERSAPAELAD